MISPYLTFKGNCEEAFNFYKSVFGGDFPYVGRFKDMPADPNHPPMAEAMQNLIMHISLPVGGGTVLMGSDTAEGFGPPLVVGNNISISFSADSEDHAKKIFTAISAGGEVTMPLERAFWGALFGMCTDKFGINWMVSYDDNKSM